MEKKEYYEIYDSKSGKVLKVLHVTENSVKTLCDQNNSITVIRHFLYRPSTKEAYEKFCKDLEKLF